MIEILPNHCCRLQSAFKSRQVCSTVTSKQMHSEIERIHFWRTTGQTDSSPPTGPGAFFIFLNFGCGRRPRYGLARFTSSDVRG